MSTITSTLPGLKRFGPALLLLLFSLFIGINYLHASPAELSEISKLKAEVHKLKIQLGTCQATVVDREMKLLSGQLSSEQIQLEQNYRKELKADEKATFNWDTLKFNSPK